MWAAEARRRIKGENIYIIYDVSRYHEARTGFHNISGVNFIRNTLASNYNLINGNGNGNGNASVGAYGNASTLYDLIHDILVEKMREEDLDAEGGISNGFLSNDGACCSLM